MPCTPSSRHPTANRSREASLPKRAFDFSRSMDAAQHFCRIVQAGAAILAAAMVLPASPAHAADAYPEDAIKAAYLYRFAGYVNWPEQRRADGPFIIDVVGSPGVARELRRLLPGHLVDNRVAQVREIIN